AALRTPGLCAGIEPALFGGFACGRVLVTTDGFLPPPVLKTVPDASHELMLTTCGRSPKRHAYARLFAACASPRTGSGVGGARSSSTKASSWGRPIGSPFTVRARDDKATAPANITWPGRSYLPSSAAEASHASAPAAAPIRAQASRSLRAPHGPA